MTPQQFWHGDPDLLPSYHKAYYKNLHTQAHAQGFYNHIAVSVALTNAFRKKGQEAENYLSKPIDPFKDEEKEKKTQEYIEKEYWRGLNFTNSWVNALSKNK